MDRAEAAALLRHEIADYAGRPPAELVALIGRTEAYPVLGASGIEYQVELEVRWDSAEGGLLRILGSIDDGTLRAAFSPVSDDALVVSPGSPRADRVTEEPVTSDPFIDRLEATGIAFEIIPCDPALADTARFCEHYGYALDDSANTIVVVGKAETPSYAACVVLATTRLDVNKVVRKRLGVRKSSFAGAEDTKRLTGMEIGGVTPVGLPPELPLWVDARVMERERIILGGGSRDRKVLAPPTILTALGAEVVEGLAKADATS